MESPKTLIIDPDSTIRERISELIRKADGVVLAGSLNAEAEDQIELAIEKTTPDVVVIGIDRMQSKEMQFFQMIRSQFSSLPVIVLTPHSRPGAGIALKALQQGAVEYVTKTQSFTGSIPSNDHFSRRLIPVIKATPRMNRSVLSSWKNVAEAIEELEPVPAEKFNESLDPTGLMVVAGCLGGVSSLYLLLASLPENLPVPTIVVQHMPKIYTRVLAEQINEISSLEVLEAEENMGLEPGKVYISPGSYNTTVSNRNGEYVIELNEVSKANLYRPSMDVLLNAVYNVYKNKVLLVYLSGGGSDGIEGAQQIDYIGGQIIIQNQHTSLLWDLPWQIQSRGLNEGGYPIERLGSEIAKRVFR